MQFLKFLLKNLFSKFGLIIRKKDRLWSLVPFDKTTDGIYQEIIKTYKIDLILDIGASTGYWAQNIRENDYKGKIISFEPHDQAYEHILKKSESDINWEVKNIALSDNDEITVLHVSKNRESSSLSKMLKIHKAALPDSYYTKEKIRVKVQKLDTLFPNIIKDGNNVFAKIDVQGFEEKVIKGASETISKIKVIQLEISFKKLYSDDAIFEEMYQLMNNLGFYLYHIFPGFRNKK